MKTTSKTLLCLLVLVGGFYLAGSLVAQDTSAVARPVVGYVGRYQLLAGKQTMVIRGNMGVVDAIYRLDTVSGQVWRLNSRTGTNLAGVAMIIEEWWPAYETEPASNAPQPIKTP